MELKLIYDGVLKTHPNPSQIHEIRKQFHPQLKRLWEIHPALAYMKNKGAIPVLLDSTGPYQTNTEGMVGNPFNFDRFQMSDMEHFADSFRVCDFRFVPLICDCFGTCCELDLLYLRREATVPLIDQQGDIDNRLKGLFDALRMPSKQECATLKAEEGENPFYCLLENDSLITAFKVQADSLLTPSAGTSHSTNEVHLVISVKVRLVRANHLNMAFSQ
jgi:hypothetical protein